MRGPLRFLDPLSQLLAASTAIAASHPLHLHHHRLPALRPATHRAEADSLFLSLSHIVVCAAAAPPSLPRPPRRSLFHSCTPLSAMHSHWDEGGFAPLKPSSRSQPASPHPSSSPDSPSSPASASLTPLLSHVLHSVREAFVALYRSASTAPLPLRLVLLVYLVLHVVVPVLFFSTSLSRTVLTYTVAALITAAAVHRAQGSTYLPVHGSRDLASPSLLPLWLWSPCVLWLPCELTSLLLRSRPVLSVDHSAFEQLPGLLLSPSLYLRWRDWLLVADALLLGVSLMHLLPFLKLRRRPGGLHLQAGGETTPQWGLDLRVRGGRMSVGRRAQERGEWLPGGSPWGEEKRGAEADDVEWPRAPPSSPAGRQPSPAKWPCHEHSTVVGGPAQAVHSCEVLPHERQEKGVGDRSGQGKEGETGGAGKAREEGEERGAFQSPRPAGEGRRGRAASASPPSTSLQLSSEELSAPHGDPMRHELESLP